MNKKGGIKLPSLDKLRKLGEQERIADNTRPMTRAEQCLELIDTVKTKIAPSSVHGVGVVAIRDISKGARCHVVPSVKPQWYNIDMPTLNKNFDKTYLQIKQLILDRWPHVINGKPFMSPNYDQRLLSFMNHSDEPNYDPITDSALRDIKEGEELFEDYRLMGPNYKDAYPWIS